MQTIVRPVATLPGAWDIEFSGGRVGEIRRRLSGFLIIPRQPTVLAGIAPGPYPSRESAMAVIAEYTRGSCTLVG
jgi:hypothetical protein